MLAIQENESNNIWPSTKKWYSVWLKVLQRKKITVRDTQGRPSRAAGVSAVHWQMYWIWTEKKRKKIYIKCGCNRSKNLGVSDWRREKDKCSTSDKGSCWGRLWATDKERLELDLGSRWQSPDSMLQTKTSSKVPELGSGFVKRGSGHQPGSKLQDGLEGDQPLSSSGCWVKPLQVFGGLQPKSGI